MGLMGELKLKRALDRYERRRHAISGQTDCGLPGIDADFTKSKSRRVVPAVGFKFTAFDPCPAESNAKLDTLAREFEGQPEILLLHAYIISHIRKKARPALAEHLFHRLWKEESDYLLQALTPRWILSAIISFGTCGENEEQRVAGEAFNMFFSLMKLYEFERLYSGRRPDKTFRIDKKVNAALPVGMTGFSLRNGDLDANLLAQFYHLGCRDPVIRRPCEALLMIMLEDHGTIFDRLEAMKSEVQVRLDDAS